MNREPSEAEVKALARALERGIPEGPAAIHFCPWPGCDDLWESEASCVHALALAARDRVVAATAAETALRDAADKVHTEARWCAEMESRFRPQNAADRLLIVEATILAHASALRAAAHPDEEYQP